MAIDDHHVWAAGTVLWGVFQWRPAFPDFRFCALAGRRCATHRGSLLSGFSGHAASDPGALATVAPVKGPKCAGAGAPELDAGCASAMKAATPCYQGQDGDGEQTVRHWYPFVQNMCASPKM